MRIWKNHDFLRLWLGQMISVVGDGIYYIAIMWWIKTHTGSDAMVALIALCAAVPGVLLGPIAGVVADRVNRRRLMIGMDVISAIVVIVPAFLLAANQLEPWHVCVTAALLATAATFSFPAFLSSVPRIVTEDQLAAANSMSQGGNALAGLIGPALGGVMVAGLSSVNAITLDAVSFGVSALLLAFSRIPNAERSQKDLGQSVIQDLLGGLRYLRSQPVLWGTLMVFSVLNLIFAPISVLIPGLAKDVLGVGAQGFGLLEASMPAGFVLGSIVAASLTRRLNGHAMIWLLCLAGLLIAAVGLSRSFVITAILIISSGISFAVTNVFFMVVFQKRIPNELQGRAFGTLGTISQGLRPVGLALTASAVGLMGGVAPVFVACGLALSVVAFGCYLVPGLAQMRHEPRLELGSD
jgi:MFS transporter, DHA3 family, macrolide efflux protein